MPCICSQRSLSTTPNWIHLSFPSCMAAIINWGSPVGDKTCFPKLINSRQLAMAISAGILLFDQSEPEAPASDQVSGRFICLRPTCIFEYGARRLAVTLDSMAKDRPESLKRRWKSCRLSRFVWFQWAMTGRSRCDCPIQQEIFYPLSFTICH